MSLHFLFTKSSKPGSKLIRWGLGQDSSHFAIGFDISGDRGIIFHSNFSGLGIAWAKDFLGKNIVVSHIVPRIELKLEAEERIYKQVVKDYGKAYDFGAFLYFAYRVLLKKIFKRPIPKVNPWGKNSHFLCTEVGENIRSSVHDIFQVMIPFTKGMISPDELRGVLVKSPFLEEKWILIP